MKFKIATLLIASCAFSSAAVITIQNGNFMASGNDTLPANWDSSEANHTTGIYVWGADGGIPADTQVLAFQGRDGRWVEQAFSTLEVTAESFPQYDISFSSGWRNNTAAPNDLSLVFAIYDFTTNTVLGSQTYTFPPNEPSNAGNNYRVIEANNLLSITYNNTDPSIEGNTIGLRITSQSSQNTFNVTGWIDNVAVTAIPEPGTAALLGLVGLAALVRRRR